MKKTFLILLTLIIALTTVFMFVGCKSNEDLGVNILSNPNFEELSTSGKEASWTVSDANAITFIKNSKDDDDYDPKLGTYYAKVNVSGAYQYAAQTVSLKKNATYMITADVKVTSVSSTDDIGFRFGFETETEEFKGFNMTKSTDNEWTKITYYFTSGEKGDAKLTIGAGSPSKNASAVAYVDNIVFTRVNEIPASYLEENEIEVLKFKKSNSLSDAGSICFVVFMSLASLAIAATVYFLIAKSVTPKEKYVATKEHSNLYNKINEKINLEKVKSVLTSDFAIFMYILVGSLLVRFIVSVCSFGMTSNIKALETVALNGKSTGLLSFYSKQSSTTTPVGGVVVYTFLANIATWLKIKSASLGYAILMRLPQIIADIVVTYLIYTFVATNKDTKNAAIYSAFYAFVPVFFFLGSFYGAMESIAIAFIVATALLMLKKDYIFTPVVYMCALLFSNYALVVFPVVLAYQIIGMIKDEESRWMNLTSVIVTFVLFYAFGFIMTFDSVKNGKVFVYFQRMYQFFKDSAYLSTDSFNLYAVFGAANTKTRSTLIEVFNWLFVIGMSAWPIYVYIKNQNRLDLILNMGLMFIAYALIGACSTVVILPIGLVLLLVYIAFVPDARLFFCYSILATLSFMNVAQLASQSGYISNVTGATYTAFLHNSAFLIIFSIVAVIALFYLIYVSIDVSYFNQSNEIAPLNKSFIKQIKSIFVKNKDTKKS